MNCDCTRTSTRGWVYCQRHQSMLESHKLYVNDTRNRYLIAEEAYQELQTNLQKAIIDKLESQPPLLPKELSPKNPSK